MKIYEVIGSCGYKTKYQEWRVILYTTEALAKEHARLATEADDVARQNIPNNDYLIQYENPYDKKCWVYDGTPRRSYHVQELEVLSEIPSL